MARTRRLVPIVLAALVLAACGDGEPDRDQPAVAPGFVFVTHNPDAPGNTMTPPITVPAS